MAVGQNLDSVFFLDKFTGWALLIGAEENADEPRFDLASTASAGKTWSISPLKFPRNPGIGSLTGGGHIDFVDPLHGWMNLPIVSSAAFRLGALLATSDGGKTWDWAPGGSGTGGRIHFTTTKDGWVAGGPGDEHLYATHDGAKSWQEVTLKAPAEAGKALYPNYEQPPVFESSRRGFLPVIFSGPEGTQSGLVLFASADEGRSWNPDRALSVGEGSDWRPSTVADSDLITILPSEDRKRRLTIVSPGNKITTQGAEIPSGTGGPSSDRLSFASRDRGWVLADGRLWLTVEGGATWTEITPHAAAHPARSNGSPADDQPTNENYVGESSGAVFPTGTSFRLGFDRCAAPGSGIMSTWWNSSPFFDLGIYLGGASLSCTNSNLTSGWVTTVNGQGWGLTPVWSGPQAPCACDPNLPPPCTPFPHIFSYTPSVAQGQGSTEATKAINAATTLGLGQVGIGSVIYYDIERYTPAAQCSAAVEAFISGWKTTLNNNLYLDGVYGAPADANSDWAYAQYPPSNVWIAKYGTNNVAAPLVTNWGLSPLCDPFSVPPCSLWSDNQRVHQYLGINKSATYGGVTLSLDYDIVDAAAVISNVTKTYSNYTVTTILYVDPTYGNLITYPAGVNDEGLVVGSYLYDSDPDFCPPGCTCGYLGYCALAFTYTNGSYSTFTVQGANDTTAYAVNNVGTIVGCWGPPPYYWPGECIHGFIMPAGGQPVTVDYPGADWTVLTGINDSAQAVGFWGNNTGNTEGPFVYSGGAFAPLTFPGATSATTIYPHGINGDGQVSGTYYGPPCPGNDTCGFVYSVPSATLNSIQHQSDSETELWGINNSGQVIGWSSSSPSGSCFIYDENTGNFAPLPSTVPCGQTLPWELPVNQINDLAQIVGGSYSSGYLATPK